MEDDKMFGFTPEEIARGITDYKKTVTDFESFRSTYIDLYPNQWVAFHSGEIIAKDSDWEKFWKQMDFLDEDVRKSSHVQFLDPNPPTLIL